MTKVDNKLQYIVASIFMLLFVLNDLMFDFLFNFKSSDYIAFGFTLLASIITFIYTYQARKDNIIQEKNKIEAYIKSNFNKTQVIFSILDIICGIVSILSGVVFIGGLFKIIKIGYIPSKCLVVANKGKTLFKSASSGSLLWTASRIMTKDYNRRSKMFTWIKNNKLTLTYCIVFGLASGYVGFTFASSLPLYAQILISLGSIVVTCLLTLLLGADKVKQALFRAYSKTLNAENYDKVTTFINSVLEEQEIKEIAKKEYEAETKAKELEAKKEAKAKALEEKSKAKTEKTEEEIKAEEEKTKAEAEKRAKIDAEKAKLAKENSVQ